MVLAETSTVEPTQKSTLEKTSQVLLMSEHRRLEAHIATEVMNRLAVANDRIVNVFGDDGAFVVQTDEHTGQLFIKPTPDNKHKPLSLTLITENGLTQDLTLYPSQNKAATLILKSPYTKARQSPEETLLPGFSKSSPNTLQEQWLQWMRKAALGELPLFEGKYQRSVRDLKGLRVKHEVRYQAGPAWVDVFMIKNTEGTSQELLEKQFYQAGDKAISLTKKILTPNESAFLYVLVEL